MASGRTSSITWFLSLLQGSREVTAIYKYVDSCTYVNLRRFVNILVSWFGCIHWNPFLFLVLFPGVMEGQVGLGREVRSRNSQSKEPPQVPLPCCFLKDKRACNTRSESWMPRKGGLRRRLFQVRDFFFSFLPDLRGHIRHFPHILLCCRHLCHRCSSPCVTN